MTSTLPEAKNDHIGIFIRMMQKTKFVNGCWIYEGWGDGKGYKKVWINGRGHYVHRIGYLLFRAKRLNAARSQMQMPIVLEPLPLAAGQCGKAQQNNQALAWT